MAEDRAHNTPITIGLHANRLNNLETLVPAVQNLGRRHVGYGVMPSHYETVGAALLWTLRQGLGAGFTAQVEDAWTQAYTLLAKTMKEAAATPA